MHENSKFILFYFKFIEETLNYILYKVIQTNVRIHLIFHFISTWCKSVGLSSCRTNETSDYRYAPLRIIWQHPTWDHIRATFLLANEIASAICFADSLHLVSPYLGHLSNLLLWFGFVAVRRSSCIHIFFSRTTEPILTKFGMC